MMSFEEKPIILERVERTMHPVHPSVRCPVIHNENPSILLPGTDVMIHATPHKKNHNLSFIGWIDPVENLLSKDRSVNVDARFEFKSFLGRPRGGQSPFESLKPLRVEGEIFFHPSLQVFVGLPAGDCF